MTDYEIIKAQLMTDHANGAGTAEALEALERMRRDTERLDWYFSFNNPKNNTIILGYLEGMKQHWNLSEWRLWIDESMKGGNNDGISGNGSIAAGVGTHNVEAMKGGDTSCPTIPETDTQECSDAPVPAEQSGTGASAPDPCVACHGTGVFQGAGMCHRCLGTGYAPSSGSCNRSASGGFFGMQRCTLPKFHEGPCQLSPIPAPPCECPARNALEMGKLQVPAWHASAEQKIRALAAAIRAALEAE